MSEASSSSARGRWRILAALMAGAFAALVLICTVLPPFVMLLIPPSVAGAEWAPWFLVIGVLVAIVAWPAAGWRRARWAAIALGGIAIALSACTLIRIPSAIARAQEAMDRGFGAGFVAATGPMALRPTPISVVDFVRGLASVPVRVERDVPMFTVAGRDLACDIYHPPAAATPHPIVISVHGGAWNGGTRRECDACSRELAARGFLVVSVDYRLLPDFRFPAQLDDVMRAIAWTRSHAAGFAADPRRIALIGRSAGAQLALLAAYAPGSGIRSVVGFYSPVDFTEGYARPSHPDPLDSRQLFIDYLGGRPDQVADTYRDASPIEHATGPQPPTLLFYGGRDHLVYIRFGRLLEQRLREHGTQAALIEIPWAEHAFDFIPNGLGGQLSLYHLERFLAATLQLGR